jgi:hypothetical protein
MDPGGLVFLALFGGACVVFGLWLRPKWRRAKQARLKDGDGLMLSGKRARERWLWMNAFGSIAMGAVMLGIVQVEMVKLARERARQKELAKIRIACTHDTLTLENTSARPVDAADFVILEWSGYLGERPDRWPVYLDKYPQLAPGQRMELRYRTTPGACEKPSIFAAPIFAGPPTSCELRFELAFAGGKERVGCQIK